MNSKRPQIYKYKDIIAYLDDYFEYYKNKNNVSLREIAGSLGVPVSLLSMVLNKKRLPTTQLMQKIFNFLELSETEVRIGFELLKIFKSQEIEEKKQSLSQLTKLKNFRESHKEEYEFSKYLSHWYYVAIKELTALPDFSEDVHWIQSKLAFAVSKREIVSALKFLKQTQILVNQNERLVASQKEMNCEDGIFRISLGGFHKQILGLISTAIEVVPREQRLLLGYTAVLTEKNISQMNEILNEAFMKIKNINNGTTDAEVDINAKVYHIELAAIPLTKNGM